jgi:hypothetical protein
MDKVDFKPRFLTNPLKSSSKWANQRLKAFYPQLEE